MFGQSVGGRKALNVSFVECRVCPKMVFAASKNRVMAFSAPRQTSDFRIDFKADIGFVLGISSPKDVFLKYFLKIMFLVEIFRKFYVLFDLVLEILSRAQHVEHVESRFAADPKMPSSSF